MPVHAQTRGVVFKSHQYTLIFPRRPVHLLRLINLKTKTDLNQIFLHSEIIVLRCVLCFVFGRDRLLFGCL